MTATPSDAVDIKDMRLFCQTRDRLAKLNVGGDFSDLVNRLRRQYIQTVGLKRYLSDMLSYHAGKPANYCTAFYSDSPPIQGKANKRVMDFLVELTMQHPLRLPPTRVEIRDAGSIRTYNI